ncbi:MAG: hypothetical protein HFJ52_06965 [Clostridia bacterium]|nr:hypothetical protein [Clostridia bacterium]
MITIKEFSHKELTDIANIEQKLREILEKKNIDSNYNTGLTEHEVQLLLEWIINQARRILAKSFGATNIDDLDLQGLCKAAQTVIHKILINIGLNSKCLTLSNILDNYDGEDHKINILDFPMLGGISKTYLLDITYKQFLAEDYTPQVIQYWNRDLGKKKILTALLKNGFLELTVENSKVYADSFWFTSQMTRQHTEELINKQIKEKYILDFKNPSKQDTFPYYDDEYLEYYYGITQDDLKTPLMIMFERSGNKEKKSWVLQTEEIARIQIQSAEVAANYREQQKTKSHNQPLQQQEDMKE